MLTILYSPHMTSVDNEAKRASGHADVPLSAAGRQLSEELGQHYAGEVPGAVFCSDLQRATTTAQIAFAARSLTIVPDRRLREYDYGDLTQIPTVQIDKELPQRIAEPFPNGESLLMVVQRMGTFLRDVAGEYEGKTIVVIGHRATKYGLEYWCGNQTLEEIVLTPWEWRAVPIWRYVLHKHTLERRFLAV